MVFFPNFFRLLPNKNKKNIDRTILVLSLLSSFVRGDSPPPSTSLGSLFVHEGDTGYQIGVHPQIVGRLRFIESVHPASTVRVSVSTIKAGSPPRGPLSVVCGRKVRNKAAPASRKQRQLCTLLFLYSPRREAVCARARYSHRQQRKERERERARESEIGGRGSDTS